VVTDDQGSGSAFSTWRSPQGAATGSARLRFVRVLPVGAGRARTVVLEGEPVTIGRDDGAATLALRDREVSRTHALLFAQTLGGWGIEDQKSSNGTFVDGKRAAHAKLVHGAVIRVGATLLLYLDEELRPGETFDAMSDRIVAQSLPMMRVHAEAALVAPHATPVLVTGATGVGKEVVAREIHRLSGRSGPFVPVNCAAIAAGVAESELFGHAEGAFTGASRATGGLFAAADGGTLFLDEIGEMPLDIQPKLLRALSSGEVRAVGSTASRTIDARVVAATNRDLAATVEAGSFRADLFARIGGYAIHLPPLRARRDDIVPLATTFLARRRAPPLSVDAAEALLLHDWPLNVRELELVCEAAAVRAAGAERILPAHLPPAIVDRLGARGLTVEVGGVTAPLSVLVPRDTPPSRDQLIQVLERLEGNIARVAAFFGKERQQIYRWARRHDIDLDAYRK
jgi:transcriptional regulator with GAF, ATPase, and Fis domain